MVKTKSGQNQKWSERKVVKSQNKKWSKLKVVKMNIGDKWSKLNVVKMKGVKMKSDQNEK